MYVQFEFLRIPTERTNMSIIDVEDYATEKEVQQFRLLFCDRPSDITGDESTTRYNVAAQLMIEMSNEDDRDLSTDEAKRQFLGETQLIYDDLNRLAHDVFMGEPLPRVAFLVHGSPLENDRRIEYTANLRTRTHETGAGFGSSSLQGATSTKDKLNIYPEHMASYLIRVLGEFYF